MSLKAFTLRASSCAVAAVLAASMILTACTDTPSSSSVPSGSSSSSSSSSSISTGTSSSSSSSSSSGSTVTSKNLVSQYYSKFNRNKMYLNATVTATVNGVVESDSITAVYAWSGSKFYYSVSAGEGNETAVLSDGESSYTLIPYLKVAVKSGSSTTSTSSQTKEGLAPDESAYTSVIPGSTVVDGITYYSETISVVATSSSGVYALNSVYCFEGTDLKYIVMTYTLDGNKTEIVYKINTFTSTFDDSIMEVPSDYLIMTESEYTEHMADSSWIYERMMAIQ